MAQHIPLIYRIVFTWIEPLSALSGALSLHFTPETYLNMAAVNAAPHYHPALQTLLTCIIGGWFIMAFNDLVTLRVFSHDLKVWQCIVTAHLLSDVVYGWALAQDVGLQTLVNPLIWTTNDWIVAVGTWPITLVKIAFLAGVGVGSGRGNGRGKVD